MADLKSDAKWSVEKKEDVEVVEVERPSPETPPTDPETPKPKHEPVETDLQLVTKVLNVDDDPTVNPWTFRMWFIGILRPRRVQRNTNPRRHWAWSLHGNDLDH
jgi:hypothetical protein